MSHPEPAHNPHAETFPGLFADPDGVVLTGFDDDGNPVTVHTTTHVDAEGAGTDVRTDDAEQPDSGEGEQPSANPTAQGGTEPSTSSGTPKKPAKSGGKPTPKPAPTTEPQ